MFITYIWVILTSLLYQAAIGGLFFVLAKSDSTNSFMSSGLLMIEPILMLVLGVFLAKKVDSLRSKNQTSVVYSTLSIITLSCFIGLYITQSVHADFAFILVAYTCLMLSFMMERIYRQRLPRDVALHTEINQSRINAITNFANRGAPILSPMVLILFQNGLTLNYVIGFVIISIFSTTSFCLLSQKLSSPTDLKKNKTPINTSIYPAEALGVWHVWHLVLMNAVLGGLFMVLSQSVLSGTGLIHFLQGPSVYFAGFWLTMLILTLVPQSTPNTPWSGLYSIMAIGACLALSSIGGMLSIILLGLAGLFFGLAINRLGTFIQHHLEHHRYSYYETRAQTGGRIALIVGLALAGFGLEHGLSPEIMRLLMGIGAIISAVFLMALFLRTWIKRA